MVSIVLAKLKNFNSNLNAGMQTDLLLDSPKVFDTVCTSSFCIVLSGSGPRGLSSVTLTTYPMAYLPL